MRWIIFLLTLATSLAAEQTNIDVEDFQRMLHDAAASVVRQMDQMYEPPEFNMPPDFMRSFMPDSGVGNREELVIEDIKEMPVFYDANFTQWHYKRFNNTNYILGASSRLVVVNKFESDVNNYFEFSKDEAVFSFTPDYMSVVTDTAIFTRSVKRNVALYVAILTESAKTSLVHVYEIIGTKGVMIALINLGLSSTGPGSAKKVSYVHSQYGGSLVVLVKTKDVLGITYMQEGSNEANHYIEVHYPSAVDMITYTIHGHGYIAVSNNTVCDVFKMDQFSRNHLLFDSLRSPREDITDLEYFRLGFHHYITLAGASQQYLYVWKSGEYALKQMFHGNGVLQIYSSTLPSCRDDVILFFIGVEFTRVYVYSGKSEIFVMSNVVTPSNFIVTPGSVTSFTRNNKAVIIFLNKAWNLQSFVIETRLEAVSNPLLSEGKEIFKYMESIQETLKEQTTQVQYIREVLQNAVRKTGDQTITAFQSFDDLHSSDGITVESINSTIFVEWEGSDLTLEEYKNGTEWLEKNVIELEKMVNEMEKIIPDVVRVDQDVDITGTKHFVGDITGSSILALSVNLPSVAGINLVQLQKEVYRLDKPHKIDGTLTFEKPLTITGNLDVETTINGIDISEEVMTTDTKQVSYAQMSFTNKVVIEGDLDIAGTVNGIKIRDEVVTLSGSHVIKGKKIFENGIISENVTTQIIDGVDINDLFENALTKSARQEITGTKTFSGGLETSDIILHGHLNGYDISALAENIVRIDKPAVITGHKTFVDDVIIEDRLTVDGKVNDLRIPEDLFLTDISQEVTGRKTFTGTVFAEDVLVSGEVDGLRIPEDIVTLSGDEEIPSTLYFTEGINVKNDIIVEGLVDGVDISEVAKEALKLNESSQFEHAVFLGPVTITGNLDVGGMVNNVTLDDIVRDVVFKDEQNIVIQSEKNFKKVVAETVKLEKMFSGFNLSVDFMKVHGDQVINGTKTFKDTVTFNTLNVGNGMVGDLNITSLYENRLSLILEDDIEKDIEFSNDVIVEGNLLVHGTIGGLRIPEDVVLRHSNQPISNKVFTNYVKVNNLIVNGDARVSGSFGGIDLERFNEDRLKLLGDQEIEGDLFIGDSEVGSIDLVNGVNGIDIQEFARNVMSKTKNQVVTASKEFTGTTTVHGKISTEDGVNGVDLAYLNEKAFKLYEDNIVTGQFEFRDITTRDVNVAGFINGVNITYLAENSLKKRGLQYVSGITTFEDGFHVVGDIDAVLVNDMIISEDVLLKNIPQTITGQFTVGNLAVSGDLFVDGRVNGLDLSEIAPNLARIDQENILVSNVTFTGPIRVINDISVSGLVNGIDMTRLTENVIFKDGYQEITGNKILKGSVTIKDVDIGFVNGIDWKKFTDDIVRIDKPQTITAAKTFLKDSEADEVHSVLTKVSTVNGRNLKDVLDDAVFVDIPANITGVKVFKSAVEITGNMSAELINGLQLRTDVITLVCSDDGPQIITGQKTFETLTANEDIDVAGTVNSYNLYDLYKDTLLTEGDQTIEGPKFFKEEVIFMKDVIVDTVNEMNLEKELITLDTDQEIEGPVIFNDNVFIKKDFVVQGLINDINITQLALEAVYLDTNQNLDGSYYFHKAVVTSDVAVSGTVNGLDLVAFDRNVSEFWIDASQSLYAIEKHAEDNCKLLEYLQNALSKSYYALEGFTLHQELEFPASYINIKSPTEITLVSLDDFGSGATVFPNVWESTKQSFTLLGEGFRTNVAKIFVSTIGSTEISIHIGIYEKDSFVLVNNTITDIPGGFKDASVVVRKQNIVILGLLFPSEGKCNLYRLNNLHSATLEIETYGAVNVGKDSTSVAMFDIRNTLYLAISKTYTPPYIRGFCKIFGQVNEGWQRIQSISIAASSSVRHFVYHGYHYLAFTNIAPVHETREPKSIQIYRNSGHDELFFTIFQKTPFDDANGLEIFEYGDLSELYITTWNETIIQVFRMEGESGLKSTFTLHGKCIKDVKALLIEDSIYLAVGQQNVKTNEPVNSVIYKSLTKGSKFTPHNFTYC